MSWHRLTLVFPLLVIKGIVTDYREICIAGVTLPKEGRREGGERDACSSVGLQHLPHAVSIFSHHRSFFKLLLLFLVPPLSPVIFPAASCSSRFAAVKAKKKKKGKQCQSLSDSPCIHCECREWAGKDDHQHGMHPPSAASYCHDHTLLLLSNAPQCEINPSGNVHWED